MHINIFLEMHNYHYIVICFAHFIMHLLGSHKRINALIVLMDFFFTGCIVLIGNKQGWEWASAR